MAVIRRRPVPTTKDIESMNNSKEMENKKMQEGVERKPRKTVMQVMQEERERMQRERLQQEEHNKEVEEEIREEEVEEVITIDNQDKMQDCNLESFIASTSRTIPKVSIESGVISVINSRNGKRITISKDVMSKLNNPKMLSISFSDDSLAIAEILPNNDNLLTVKNCGRKVVIYSSGLVSEITDKYGLDFSNRTSITFSEVNYFQSNGYTVATIKIR